MNYIDPVVSALFQDQRCPLASWLDVVPQIEAIDSSPDRSSGVNGLIPAEMCIVSKETVRFLENRFAQTEKPLDVPTLDVVLVSVDVDGKVEVVRNELGVLTSWDANLKNVQTLEDQDVRLAHCRGLSVDDVIDHMAVDGSFDNRLTALQVAEEFQESPGVVALGETLAVHDSAILENSVRVEESIGRDQIDLGMIRPAGKEGLKNSRERALADSDTSCNSDDVRHLWRHCSEECRTHLVKILRGRNVEIQQASQGKVDRSDFVEVDPLVDAAKSIEIRFTQRHWSCRSQLGPRSSIETLEPFTHGARRYVMRSMHREWISHRDRRSRKGVSGRPSRRHRSVAPSQDFGSIIGHKNGVFELGGSFAIGCHSGPVVFPHRVLPGPECDHRLDREDHSWFHGHVVALVEIVQDLDVGVELLTDSMTDE